MTNLASLNKEELEQGYDDDVYSDNEVEREFSIEDARVHSEYMGLKEVHNFGQDTLKTRNIFMLDYGSQIFLWVGSKVPPNRVVGVFKFAGRAIKAINSRGSFRLRKIALSLIFEGFEPEEFKRAFKG